MSASRLVPGIDVPWVTCWSEEPMGPVRPIPELGGRLGITQVERPGVGRPIYSENHLARQRLSALFGLCPMCGEAARDGDRWSLTARRVRVRELRASGLRDLLPPGLGDKQWLLNAGAIAPLHKACAARSAGECPHLRSHGCTEPLAFPERIILLPLAVQATPPPGGAIWAQPQRPRAVIGFVQILGVFD